MTDALTCCTRRMTPGLRYGMTDEPIRVHLCLECGAETPGLSCCRRPGRAAGSCERCEAQLVGKKPGVRFCSKLCANRARRPERIVKTCLCGASFDVPAYRANRRTYCSVRCYRIATGRRVA